MCRGVGYKEQSFYWTQAQVPGEVALRLHARGIELSRRTRTTSACSGCPAAAAAVVQTAASTIYKDKIIYCT
jgi:hypothetical protein